MKRMLIVVAASVLLFAGVALGDEPRAYEKVVKDGDTTEVEIWLPAQPVVQQPAPAPAPTPAPAPPPAAEKPTPAFRFVTVGLDFGLHLDAAIADRLDLYPALGISLIFRPTEVWSIGVRVGEGYGGTIVGPQVLPGFPTWKHEHTVGLWFEKELSDRFGVGGSLHLSNLGGILEPSWGFQVMGGLDLDFRLSKSWSVVVTPKVGLDGAADNKGGFTLAPAVGADAFVRVAF